VITQKRIVRFFPTKAKKFHYNFPDPAKAKGTEEEILNQFRIVRNMIKEYSEKFVAEKYLKKMSRPPTAFKTQSLRIWFIVRIISLFSFLLMAKIHYPRPNDSGSGTLWAMNPRSCGHYQLKPVNTYEKKDSHYFSRVAIRKMHCSGICT